MNKLKRYLLFLVGLFINALGVSLITKASLGTSPISSIPYVLSLNFKFTLGNFTIFFSIFLILLQILILRKNFKLENILQIPVSIAFGYFIDLTMYLFFWVDPKNYLVKVIALLVGCAILGFGVYLEVLADVVMLPGESFVRAIVQTWKTNFGTTKIIFDISMAVIAAALSFLFSGQLNGVREGTIIAALLVGFIARVLGKKLEFIKPVLFPEEYETKREVSEKIQNGGKQYRKNIIVIGRQYGSGGRTVGKMLAEKLGVSFYDKQIIQMASDESGIDVKLFGQVEEGSSVKASLFNKTGLYKGDLIAPDQKGFVSDENIFNYQAKIATDLAEKESCVIVGRCVNYVFKDRPNTLRVFVHAPWEFRVEKSREKISGSDEEIKKFLRRDDKRKQDYYRKFAGGDWSDATNYDLCLNAGKLGFEKCVDAILAQMNVMGIK